MPYFHSQGDFRGESLEEGFKLRSAVKAKVGRHLHKTAAQLLLQTADGLAKVGDQVRSQADAAAVADRLRELWAKPKVVRCLPVSLVIDDYLNGIVASICIFVGTPSIVPGSNEVA